MNERREKIYAILNKKGSASIEQLKHEVFASEATLRRDLTQMEQEGLLIRTWGGAISTGNINSDPPQFVRSNTNVREKNTIARIASGFLQNNATIFLASGTTVTKLAKYLHQYENLTVITNNLETVSILSNHTSARVIVAGGELYENCDLIGPLTERTIECFNADLFFFSCSGLTAEGFSSVDMTRLNIIQKIQKNIAKTILLADTSKVGKKYTYRGFGFDEIDYVVMETNPGNAALKSALGKKLITSNHLPGSFASANRK